MFRKIAICLTLAVTLGVGSAATTFAGESTADSCKALPVFKNLDCKDKQSVFTALNTLHKCMKSRFTYEDKVYAAAWPLIDVPESGPITGGDGDWSVGCMEAWPCKDSRLAFVEKTGELPHLVMVSKTFVVDHQLDKVYDRKDLSNYKILKVSGLKPDEAWFTVESKGK